MALKKRGFVAGAAVGVGVAAAAMAGAGMRWPGAAAQNGQNVTPAESARFGVPQGAPMSFADIFEKVAPAVVSIEVTSRVTAEELRQAVPGLPFNLVPRGNGGGAGRGGTGRGGANGGDSNDDDLNSLARQLPEQQAAGSGFFVSPEGYVVTNAHVVQNATNIKVTLNDKRELIARVVGRDEATDLAVLKVDGGPFPFVTFERGVHPRVGDWVLAVGNPYLLGGTATAGIVSANARQLPDTSSQWYDYLQIDAPINRGNSGGPTFDIYGRVIGVNTAIFSPTGGSVGIGFAIPADTADEITRQLIRGGRIVRGYLGVSIQNVTTDTAASLGIPANRGALVGDVTAGGPADRAGVQPLDVILAVNGRPVNSSNELSRATALAQPGQPIALTVLRNGRTLTLQARSGTRPTEQQLARTDGGGDDNDTPNGGRAVPNTPSVLGMSLAPLDPVTRQRLGVGSAIRGVAIVAVTPQSDAGKQGLSRGDVIVRAGEHLANTPADVAAAVADARRAGRPSVLLLVSHNGRTVALPVKLDGAGTGPATNGTPR